jgi:superfamily II DNA/RNA helicase
LITLFKLLAEQREMLGSPESTSPAKSGEAPTLQLVLSSATMPSRTRGYINAHSESLFGVEKVHKVNLVQRDEKPSVPATVEHFAMVVSPDGTTTDLAEYTEKPEVKQTDHAATVGYQIDNGSKLAPNINAHYSISSYLLDRVAQVFKEERVQHALVVVRAEAPAKRIVEQLRLLGVKAKLFDMITANVAPTAEEASMLVCSDASVHGIDLPSLTHVFMIGAPTSVYMYRHIAGRVGRQGRRGAVITFLESRQTYEGGGNVVKVLDEPRKMRKILSKVGIELGL